MRWTVEADTARDVVRWPEEFDDFVKALRSDFTAERATSYADGVSGSLSARFEVEAANREAAEAIGRSVMTGALQRAGLQHTDAAVAFLAATRVARPALHVAST
jgi:hypothetical protein